MIKDLKLFARLLGKLPYSVRGFKHGLGFANCAYGDADDIGANPLREFFEARHDGRGIWKWSHYFDIYHRHLQRFIGRSVHVAEIGVYSGGSLEMWRSYFGPGCTVHGIDIQAACMEYADDSTRIHIGDQSDRAFWGRFREKVPQIDVLIDDGSHRPEHQIPTLEEMLPHLRPGGVYLCEDIHGEHNGFSAYLHGLAKHLNAPGAAVSPLRQWIGSIHLYPYVAVIEKRASPLGPLEAPRHGTQWQPFRT